MSMAIFHRKSRRKSKALRDPQETIRAFWRNLERLARQPAPRRGSAARSVAATVLHDKP